MKLHYAFIAPVAILFSLAGITCADDSLHMFMTPDGKTLKASILEYNDRNGKIWIERQDGRKLWVDPKIFGPHSQQYIRQWILTDAFMSPTTFSIQAEVSKDTITAFENFGDSRCKTLETTKVEYEVLLKNKSDYSFKDLKVEFRSFILIRGYGDNDDWREVAGGSLRVDDLAAGATLSKQTLPVKLRTTYEIVKEWSSAATSYTYYSKKTKEDELEGTWIRVYGPVLDGKPSIREWFYPSDIIKKYAWTDDYEQVAQVSSEAVASSSPPARKEHPINSEVLSLMRQGSKCMRSDPAKALEMLHEAYRKSNSANAESSVKSHIESQIGLCYIRYLKPNDISLGIEWLTKAAERDDLGACCRLAKFYSTYTDARYHDTNKAIEYGLKAVSLSPENYNGYDVLAEAYSRDGKYDEAVEQKLIAIKLYKASGGSAQGIANMEKALQHYRNSAEAVASGSQPVRDPLSLMRQAGRCLRSDPAKSLEIYQELYRESNSVDIERQIGICYIWYLKPNDIKRGIEWLEKAAARNDYHACVQLARFYSTYIDVRYHDAEKGIEYGLKAVSLNSKEYRGYDKLAEAYSRGGQFDKAVENQLIAKEMYKASGGSEHGIAAMEETLLRYRNHIPCSPY